MDIEKFKMEFDEKLASMTDEEIDYFLVVRKMMKNIQFDTISKVSLQSGENWLINAILNYYDA